MNLIIKDYLISMIYTIATLDPVGIANMLENGKEYEEIFLKRLDDRKRNLISKKIQEEYASFKNEYKKRTEDLYYHYYVRFCLEYKTCAYVLVQIVNSGDKLEDIKILLEETLRKYKELYENLVILSDKHINKLPAELLSWVLLNKMKKMNLITEDILESLIKSKRDFFSGGRIMKKSKTKRNIKSCNYCQNYSRQCRYCYEFGIDISSTRNATHCTKYDEVSESKKNKIRNNLKHKKFYRRKRRNNYYGY